MDSHALSTAAFLFVPSGQLRPLLISLLLGRLADVLIAQYPCLRQTIRTAASDLLSASLESAAAKMSEVLSREKDPFTMNDFLQQQVNKLKVDRFNQAVDSCFENAKTPASDWAGLKEEIYVSMRQWYRQTHR
jgi:interferon-induced GTP-binding protein Mx